VKNDEVIVCNNTSLFIDPKAIMTIVGTNMDYVETNIGSEFTFTNPNSKGDCGCGESFTT
jgi:iron-sulfur cluster assembly protein